MTFYVENNTSFPYDNKLKKMVEKVVLATIKQEHFTYDFELNLQITNNEEIKKCNVMFRKINKETDVLSFPNLDFKSPADYSCLNDLNNKSNYINLDTKEVVLGDIIISYEKVLEQANDYGHSITREFCFLIAHSMLHLLGYDHIKQAEADVMEYKQEAILQKLKITKDIL